MDLLRKLHQRHSRYQRLRRQRASIDAANTSSSTRLCRFELMEPRRLLAVDFLPLQIGAVYLEDASSHDEASDLTMPDGSQSEIADLIEITWQGGAPNTQLTELTIDTDKVGDGLTIGDVFFDTQFGAPGAFDHLGLSILENNDFDVTGVSVDDGSTLLTLYFSGFEAGEKLVLTVDVDEQGFLGSNAVAEGNEFEGSEIIATFEAPHYYTATGSDIFFDYYDISLSGLDLPPDPYVPPSKYMPAESEPGPVYTAAAIFPVPQTPLPISLAGNVFIDLDMDNIRHPDEPKIGNVTVTLYDSSGKSWTQQTKSDGTYKFENLLPDVYLVVESQPTEYDSVGAIAGTVDTVKRGLVTSVDSIGHIELFGGEQSVDNDFGEIFPSTISGRVHADQDLDFVYDQGEELLSGVTIRLLDASGKEIATKETDSVGEYIFTGLLPGTYTVEEVHPQGYLDARDYVGTAGGELQNPDSIINIPIVSGTEAVRYDFVEVSPARICGYVFVDEDGNGVRDPEEEPGINGVELILLDADGNPTGETAISGAVGPDGLYCFGDLWPGVYGVEEVHPEEYIDGTDKEGSAGGEAHNPGDLITGAILTPGVHGINYNFGELEPASIGGRIHADIIRNCKVDPGEPLLAGVTVYLLNAAGNRIGSTETNEKGQYLFENLAPGTYGVHEIQPEEYLDGPDHVGTAGGQVARNDVVMGAVLGSGVDATGYNFCELVPASISGYVFQDGDPIVILAGAEVPDPATIRDGKLTDDDKRIANVVLQLGDGSGAPIIDDSGDPILTVSDANGYYEFDRLEPGLYTVLEVHPEAYTDSIDTAGTHGGIAVNPHQMISPFILGQLAIDPKADAIIRIPINPGDSAVSYNFSEVLVIELPPPPTPRPDPDPEPEPPPVFFPEELPVAKFYPPPVTSVMLPLYGSGGPNGYTWHLSVVNAGRPRRDRGDEEGLTSTHDSIFDPVAWTGPDINQAQWVIANGDGVPAGQYMFGLPGAVPVSGDFDGDGLTEIGVFIDGQWFLDLNGNGRWDKDDFWAKLGTAGDLPVTGDWDGDGKTDIGIYGPAWVGDLRAIAAEPGLPDSENAPTGKFKNLPPDPDEATVGWRTLKRTSQGKLRNDLIDHVFHYGTAGDWPTVGDWNGDGIATVGVFRDGTWSLDVDGDGRWSDGDRSIKLGQEDDLPVVGDWDGDGIDQLGVYRSGKWILDTNNDHVLDAHDKVFELGGPDDRPVVGDFNGDGIDEPAVYHDGDADSNLKVFNPTDPATDTVAGVVREAR